MQTTDAKRYLSILIRERLAFIQHQIELTQLCENSSDSNYIELRLAQTANEIVTDLLNEEVK